MELIYKVDKNDKYSNLREILKNHFKISNNLLTTLKLSQKIFVNNLPVYINHQIKINDIIKINLDIDENSENIVSKKMNLEIIFEDEAMLIVNKPSGLPVHPSILHYTDSLSNGIKFYFESINLKRKIRPVNRLDKDTSGIVIFAKNEYIQELLIQQMKNKTFKKEYIAILTGILNDKFGTISAPIARKKDSIIEREINVNGDISITHFEVLKEFENLSLVKFILETGRTHQIRIHSKYIGHPILGDTLYGNPSELIKRQALHAYKVSFIHPLSKKEIILSTELPKDIKKIIK